MTPRVKTQLIGVLLFASFFSACGGENFAQIRNIRSAGETIICFGDRLTEGVGAGEGEDYPSALSRQLASPVVNAGRRGDTTADALERLSDTVLSKNPRLVIVLLGGNDFLRQRPRQETRKNLEEIVRRVQARGAIVAIVGMRLGLFTDEHAAIFEETCSTVRRALHPGGNEGHSLGCEIPKRSDPSQRRRVSSDRRAHRRKSQAAPTRGRSAQACEAYRVSQWAV
jgi:hypothetical protein